MCMSRVCAPWRGYPSIEYGKIRSHQTFKEWSALTGDVLALKLMHTAIEGYLSKVISGLVYGIISYVGSFSIVEEWE